MNLLSFFSIGHAILIYVTQKTKRLQAYSFLLLNTLVWGAFIPIVKLGFNDSAITPFRFLLYRFVLAGLLITPFIWTHLKKVKNKWRIFLLEVIQVSVGLSFLYLGLKETTALETSFIATSLPLFIIIGGIVFLREKQEKNEWLGLILAIIGTLIITLEPLWHGTDGFGGSLTGNLLILGYNISTAIYFLLAKKYYRKLPKLLVSGLSFYVGALTFAIFSLLELGGNLTNLVTAISIDLDSYLVWGVIAYAAILGSIVGLTAYIKGQDGIEASEASLFTYLQPVIYIPLGFWLLGEAASLGQIFALAIIILGVYIAGKKKEL